MNAVTACYYFSITLFTMLRYCWSNSDDLRVPGIVLCYDIY